MNIFEGRKTYRCPHCGDDSVFPGYETCSSCGGAVSGKAKEEEPGSWLQGCVSLIGSLILLGLFVGFIYYMWKMSMAGYSWNK